MKKFFKNLGPLVIPELKVLFFIIIPFSILLTLFFTFVLAGNSKSTIESLLIIGFILGIAGSYFARFVSWMVKKRVTSYPEAQGDIYEEDTEEN